MAKSNSELLERAYGIAESFFYSDDDCDIAWEPLEDLSKNELKDLTHDLAQSILLAMEWAQNEN
jgi:hypothetical protein